MPRLARSLVHARLVGIARGAMPTMHRTVDSSTSDEDLMRAWQCGNASAFETLYRRYRGTLYRFLVRQAGDEATGEELYQDVWMTLVRGRDRWTPAAALRTYLYRIAHSRLIDHSRRRNRRGHLVDVSIDAKDAAELADNCSLPSGDARWESRSAAEALRRCLEALPAAQREAFLLKEEAGFGLGEIAAITEAGAETVKSRVRYAIGGLRRCLEGLL